MEPHSDWCLIYTPAVIAGGQVALRVETTDARLDIDAGGTGWLRDWDGYGFELFGQFNRVVEDRDTFFRQAVTQLADGVGLAAQPTGTTGEGDGSSSGS